MNRRSDPQLLLAIVQILRMLYGFETRMEANGEVGAVQRRIVREDHVNVIISIKDNLFIINQ